MSKIKVYSSNRTNLLPLFVWALLSLMWACFLLLFLPTFTQYQMGVAVFLFGFIAIAIINNKDQLEKAPYLTFMVVYIAFHFGILPTEINNPGGLLEQGAIYNWYYSGPLVREALNISMIFLVGYVLSSCMPKRNIDQITLKKKMLKGTVHYYDRYFIILLIIMCAVWFLIVTILLEITNYTLYNDIARGSDIGILGSIIIFIYPLIGIILFLGLLHSRNIWPLISVYSVWGAVAFVIGLRGEVLFPLAMSIPILIAQRRMRLQPVIVALSIAGILISSSFIRTYRNVSSFSESISNISILDSLAELGGSLRPAYETASWISTGILEFQQGATYYAPFERTFLTLFPIMDSLPAREDFRLMNVAIFELTNGGSYGFSIAAEAYINFGLIGAFVIGLLVGLVMLRFGRKTAHEIPSLALIALVYGLYYHVRQSFVGAFGSFVVVLVAGIVITSVMNRKPPKDARSDALKQE